MLANTSHANAKTNARACTYVRTSGTMRFYTSLHHSESVGVCGSLLLVLLHRQGASTQLLFSIVLMKVVVECLHYACKGKSLHRFLCQRSDTFQSLSLFVIVRRHFVMLKACKGKVLSLTQGFFFGGLDCGLLAVHIQGQGELEHTRNERILQWIQL